MALDHNVTLSKDTVVMYVVFHYSLVPSGLTFYIRVWISSQDASAVTAKGLRIVHSPSDYFYLVINYLLFCIAFPSDNFGLP
jgi:hexosaminidase